MARPALNNSAGRRLKAPGSLQRLFRQGYPADEQRHYGRKERKRSASQPLALFRLMLLAVGAVVLGVLMMVLGLGSSDMRDVFWMGLWTTLGGLVAVGLTAFLWWRPRT